MSIRYKEELKREKVQSWRLLGIIILLSLFVNFVVTQLNKLENTMLAGYLSIGVLIVMTILTFRLINYYVTEFEYTLTHQSLKVTKILGKRTKDVVETPLEKIITIVSKARLEQDHSLKKKVTRSKNLTLINMKKDVFVGYYKEGEKLKSFSFQPNEKMIAALRKELGDTKVLL